MDDVIVRDADAQLEERNDRALEALSKVLEHWQDMRSSVDQEVCSESFRKRLQHRFIFNSLDSAHERLKFHLKDVFYL